MLYALVTAILVCLLLPIFAAKAIWYSTPLGVFMLIVLLVLLLR